MNGRKQSPAARRLKGGLFASVLGALSLLGFLPLAAVVVYVFERGWSALTWTFVTELPTPAGMAGGVANGIEGSFVLVGLALLVGLPIGVGVGIYLADYAHPAYGKVLRFLSDVLSGVPSIVVGLLAYAIIVVPMGRFSAIAGGLALALIIAPPLIRTTEQMLLAVPRGLREGAYALGATRLQTTMRFVLPTAARGLATASLLAVSRAMGETAPLLFTALGSHDWPRGLTSPIAALPLFIYNYAMSSYPARQAQAWAGALTLLALVFLIHLAARLLGRSRAI